MKRKIQCIRKLILIFIMITALSIPFAQTIQRSENTTKYSTPKPRHNLTLSRRKTKIEINRYSTKIDFDKKLKNSNKLLN